MTNNLNILEKHTLKLRLIYQDMQEDFKKTEAANMFFTEKVLKDTLDGLSATIKRLETGQEVIRHVLLEAKIGQ